MLFNLRWLVVVATFSIVVVKVEGRTKVGHLQTKGHGVKGTVYILNDKQLLIQQFTFLGRGDVDFYVGTVGSTPNFHGGTELSHSHTEGTSDHIVEDIILDLPSDMTTDKINWLAVFSQTVNVGDLIFSHQQNQGETSGAFQLYPNITFCFSIAILLKNILN